jgi:hypothetical protein
MAKAHTTPAKPQAPAKQTEAQTILARSVCLTLECHFLGNHRKVETDDLVKEAGGDAEGKFETEQFNTTKKLLDTKELAPCMRKFALAKVYLRSVAVSAHRVFGERTYLVPRLSAEEVDAQLEQYAADLRAEAVALAGRYRAAVERQKVALGAQFRAGDYVTPEQVVQAFSLDWAYVSFAAPENIETISHALALKAHRKHEARLATAFDEVMANVRQTAFDVMAELVDRLEPVTKDGRKKGLRGDALDNLREFAERLPKLNSMVGDDKLVAVMKKVEARLAGVDVQRLKDDTALHTELRKVADEAKAALGKLVQQGPRRGIRLPGAAGKADAA